MATHFLNLRGGRLAYDDQGTGPLAICVPGMGDLRGEYRFLTPHLFEAGYRVVSIDVRGHGETTVSWPDYSVGPIGEDILALVRHLAAGPAVVVGTSMAAGAAVCAAATEPDSITGIILVSPFVRAGTMPQWQEAFLQIVMSAMFADPWGASMWASYYGRLYPTSRPPDFNSYVGALKRNLREPGRLAALRQMLRASKQASEDRLDSLRTPALVVMGSHDPDFKDPAGEARLVAQRLHSRVEIIAGAGHYPHAEMPEQTAGVILPFIESIRHRVGHDVA